MPRNNSKILTLPIHSNHVAVIKMEDNNMNFHSMGNLAAQSRPFGHTYSPKKTKIWPYFDDFGRRRRWRSSARRPVQ